MLDHDHQTDRQFSGVAAAYLSSEVHAQGEDLQRLARFAAAGQVRDALDLGCGAGHVAFSLAPHVRHIVAYDLSAAMLDLVAAQAARRGLGNLTTRRGAAEILPFADRSFDLVCSRFSAHHWQSVPAALDEIRRVLKPGGSLIMIDILGPDDPLCDTYLQAIEVLRDRSHCRDHSAPQWDALLAAARLPIKDRSSWRLRLDFQAWVERMRTPPVYVAAIRSLLDEAPNEVKRYLELEDDYSFQSDVIMLECSVAPEK